MTKNTWLITLLVVLNLVSLGALWFSKDREHKQMTKEDHKAMLHKVFKEELGLDEKQQVAFSDLTNEHFQKRKDHVKAIREKKRELLEAVAAETEDTIAINALVNEITSLERANEEFFIEHFRNLKAVCTPEQQKNLARVFLRGMRPHGSPDHEKE